MSKLIVRDLMSDDVFSVLPDDEVGRVREIMDERHVRHVPVIDDDGAVVGIVSHRDLVRTLLSDRTEVPLSMQEELLARTKVSEIMSHEPETIDPDEPVSVAAAMMLDGKFGCLPVLESGAVVGILTESDFLRYFLE